MFSYIKNSSRYVRHGSRDGPRCDQRWRPRYVVQLYLLSLYQGRGRVLMKTAPGSQPMPILQANTAETNLRMALMRRAFFAHAISVELRSLLPCLSDDKLFETWYKYGPGTR
jgi:hypothetical protein